MKPGPARFDLERAVFWRRQGLTWAAIGRVLAKEEGRAVPYQADSISRVVRPRLNA